MEDYIHESTNDTNLKMYNKMARFLEISYFDLLEMEGDNWDGEDMNLDSVESTLKKIHLNGLSECTTVTYIKEVLKVERVDLELLYHRKHQEIYNLMVDLNSPKAGFEFFQENGIVKCEYELPWRVGYLFQHPCFYKQDGESQKFPTYCTLNQPQVNRRQINELTLLQMLHYIRDKGTGAFEDNAGLVAPYEVSRYPTRDLQGEETSCLVQPMVSMGTKNPDSKCHACPIKFSTLEDLFHVLTGRYIDKRTFPKLFAVGISHYDRVYFALYAVLMAIDKVYDNLEEFDNIQDLFLVCYLHNSSSRVIDLKDFANEEYLTFPIGFRELMKQTKLVFQAITPLRFSWLNCQMKQSAVTTYLVGKNPFYCNKLYAKSFDQEINEENPSDVGRYKSNYWYKKFVDYVTKSYTANIVLVKHQAIQNEQEADENNLFSMSSQHGARSLREMSTFFISMSSKRNTSS